MRVWRNWQTRQTQDLVPWSAGSIPVTRTIIIIGPMVQWLTCQSVTLEIASSSLVGTAINNLRPQFNWIEYLTTDQGVRGSNPLGRAILKQFNLFNREIAQLGRALGLGPRCRRFESCFPDPLRVQFNGRTSAFQADYVGSIPITRSIF